MGLGNVLILAQVTAYLIAFILSFFLFIPLGANQNEFKGHCLLYSTGTWNDTSQELHIKWGSDSACDYSIFMGVMTMLISLFYVIWMSVYLYREREPSWLSAFVALLISGCGTIMMFISSLVLSVGFGKWCSLIENGSSKTSCEDVEHFSFEQELYRNFPAQYFYLQFGMAQAASWITWLCWTFLFVLSAFQMYKYNKLENFLVSMGRERERLIQKVNPRPTQQI